MDTLTNAQNAIWKADIELNHADLVASHDYFTLRDVYNTIASPNFFAWKTNVSIGDIFDKVTWENFTPANPSSPTDDTLAYVGRVLACQGKQFNLQTMLMGREIFNASKPILRNGLKDATTSIPSGTNGATKTGGWASIEPILMRPTTILEKIFSVGTGTALSPAVMSIEGLASYEDVKTAMGW